MDDLVKITKEKMPKVNAEKRYKNRKKNKINAAEDLEKSRHRYLSDLKADIEHITTDVTTSFQFKSKTLFELKEKVIKDMPALFVSAEVSYVISEIDSVIRYLNSQGDTEYHPPILKKDNHRGMALKLVDIISEDELSRVMKKMRNLSATEFDNRKELNKNDQ